MAAELGASRTVDVRESGLDIAPIITHRFPDSAFREAFETMASGHCGKIILDWEAEA